MSSIFFASVVPFVLALVVCLVILPIVVNFLLKMDGLQQNMYLVF